MITTPWSALPLTLAVAVLAGCSDGDVTGPDAGLDSVEAVALIEAVLAAGFEPTPEPRPELTVPCPLGGSVTVTTALTVNGDPEAPTGISLRSALRHEACVTGIFTLDGAPALTFALELSVSALPALAATGTATGSVRWSTTDGRNGTCALDLDISAEDLSVQAVGGPMVTLTGRACGHDVTLSQ